MNSSQTVDSFCKQAFANGDVLNCTDHAINVAGSSGRCHTFNPTGYVIRVAMVRKTHQGICVQGKVDIDVSIIEPIGLFGMPDDDEKSIYLVSKSTLDYAGLHNLKLKSRLFAPDTTMGEIRGKGGKVVAVTRLLTYSDDV